MSQLLPRTQLNRGYVALLVLNCWSTALIHSAFHKDTATRRLVAIVCDCVLDLVSSAILLVYSAEFDFEQRTLKWYEDVWLVHAINEFNVLLVTSWGVLTMRVVFALSMISNMSNMKKILTSGSSPRGENHASPTSVVPLHLSSIDAKTTRTPSDLQVAIAKKYRLNQALFFAWGVDILVLHLFAESIPALDQCMMQVKPRLSSAVVLSAIIVLDCYASRPVGTEDEVSVQRSPFDPAATDYIVLRHCPKVDIPA